jgi:phosphoglycolate phosphatase-like HAD superfamily hydrolase
MPKLVLFDIDGTLVLTGGAGMRALDRALEDTIGHVDALEGVPVSGRTDWSILQDTLGRLGMELDERLFARVRDRYLTHLAEEILLPGKGVNAVLPGVSELLDVLHQRDDVFLALLTGNFKLGAQIKLERFDLWRYFRCGAFGDDHADRNALVPVALARATECGLPAIAPSDVFVVGDTPNDVACAHASGAIPVAVATGMYSIDQLRACGSEIVFDTLQETEKFVRLLE